MVSSQAEPGPCSGLPARGLSMYHAPVHPGPVHLRAEGTSSLETLQGVGSHPFSSRALLFCLQSTTLGWPRVRSTSLSLQVCGPGALQVGRRVRGKTHRRACHGLNFLPSKVVRRWARDSVSVKMSNTASWWTRGQYSRIRACQALDPQGWSLEGQPLQ